MKSEKQQFLIIQVIVFLGAVGTSIAYPIFPVLFLHPEQSSLIPSTWGIDYRGLILGVALALYPLGEFIGSAIIGSCSDRYGRKNILLISLFGSFIGYTLTTIAIYANILWLLFLSRFFTGLMEGNLGIVKAMASDLKSIGKYKSFGKIDAMISIGYITGPLLGSFFTDKNILPFFSYYLPFALAMILSLLTAIFVAIKLMESEHIPDDSNVTLWQRFNLIARFKIIFNNQQVKYIIIVSSMFTLAIDAFYEFGPVYLTANWHMMSSSIAIYNTILSITLAIGSMLPQLLSRHYSNEKITIFAILATAMSLGFMVFLDSPLLVFILFGVVGISISIGTTSLTIKLSDATSKKLQGEVLGTQISLRMLGDALMCTIGGVILASSIALPIVLSGIIALIAGIMYIMKFGFAAHKKP